LGGKKSLRGGAKNSQKRRRGQRNGKGKYSGRKEEPQLSARTRNVYKRYGETMIAKRGMQGESIFLMKSLVSWVYSLREG